MGHICLLPYGGGFLPALLPWPCLHLHHCSASGEAPEKETESCMTGAPWNPVSLPPAQGQVQYRRACLATQSCPTLWDPMDCSPPGSSVLEIFQATILEWVAISSSIKSPKPRDRACISCSSYIAGKFFTTSYQGSPP